MATTAMNHASNPLLGRTTVPTGNAVQITWQALENALRRAGEIRQTESVPCFIVADDGVWLVLEKSR